MEDFGKLNRVEIKNGLRDVLETLIEKKWGQKKVELLVDAWRNGYYEDARIPGINVPCENLWDIMNSMSWVASGQRILSKQEKMLADCDEILRQAMRKAKVYLN